MDDRTLRTYDEHSARYIAAASASPSSALVDWIDRFMAALPADPTVLEVGSGPGGDALLLEARGARVIRSDASAAFASRLRAHGHGVLDIDIRTDPLPSECDGVFANAVLLHLRRDEFGDAVGRIHAALRAGGVFAFTLKEGDGEEWSDAKLGAPRFFAYWRRDDVAEVLSAAGFADVAIRRAEGPTADWLQVVAVSAPAGAT